MEKQDDTKGEQVNTTDEQVDTRKRNIDSGLATVVLLMENKAYLKTILSNQERILAYLQDRNMEEIMKETDEMFREHYEAIKEDVLERFEAKS
jgi:hypothetical protein